MKGMYLGRRFYRQMFGAGIKGTLRRFAPWTAAGRSGETRRSRGKKGGGRAVWTARKGTFRPYQPPEPQPRGAVTRRAVAQRRSRASGLTRPSAEAIRGFGLGFVVVSSPIRRGMV